MNYIDSEVFHHIQDVLSVEIIALLRQLYEGNYGISVDRYPARLEDRIQQAVSLKRQGRYDESVKIYLQIMNQEKVVYSTILYYLYKTLASACCLTYAYIVLELSERIIEVSIGLNSRGIPYEQTLHKRDLLECLIEFKDDNDEPLFNYLSSISGNREYKFVATEADIMNQIYYLDSR